MPQLTQEELAAALQADKNPKAMSKEDLAAALNKKPLDLTVKAPDVESFQDKLKKAQVQEQDGLLNKLTDAVGMKTLKIKMPTEQEKEDKATAAVKQDSLIEKLAAEPAPEKTPEVAPAPAAAAAVPSAKPPAALSFPAAPAAPESWKSEMKKAGELTKEAFKPQDKDAGIKDAMNVISGTSLDPALAATPIGKAFLEQKKKMEDLITAAREERQDINRRTILYSAIEKISLALTKFAAAQYGLKHNIDAVSGVKFEPSDWNRIMQGSVDEVKDRIAAAQSSLDKLEGRADESGKLLIAARKEAANLERQGKMQEAENYRRYADALLKQEESQKDRASQQAAAAASRQTQLEIAKLGAEGKSAALAQQAKEGELKRQAAKEITAMKQQGLSNKDVAKQLSKKQEALTKIEAALGKYSLADSDKDKQKFLYEMNDTAAKAGLKLQTKEEGIFKPLISNTVPDVEALQTEIARQREQLGTQATTLDNMTISVPETTPTARAAAAPSVLTSAAVDAFLKANAAQGATKEDAIEYYRAKGYDVSGVE